MAPFDKLFRRNSSQIPPVNAPPPSATYAEPPAIDTQIQNYQPQPQPQPSSRPNPAAGHAPNPNYQSTGQNTGLLVGGAVGVMGGGGDSSIGTDMIAGQVVGGMVGQKLAQAERNAYWRGQAMEYREQLAAGMAPLSEQMEGEQRKREEESGEKPSWWSREGRELRRVKRWERRAARRG